MSFCMDFFVQLHRICLRSCVFNVLLFSHTFIYTLFLYPLTRDGRTMVSVFMRLCQKRFSANSLSVSCVCVFFFSVCLKLCCCFTALFLYIFILIFLCGSIHSYHIVIARARPLNNFQLSCQSRLYVLTVLCVGV